MKNVYKKILSITIALLLVVQVFGSLNVFAFDNNQSREIEKYTRTVDVPCDKFGYVTVKVVISHNMTTGKKMVYSKDYDTHFDKQWFNVQVSKVKTTPAVGSVIKGNTIKVEVTAYQFGLQSVTGNGTIYL